MADGLTRIKETLLQECEIVTSLAESKTRCKRKGVGCQLTRFHERGMLALPAVYNGPAHEDLKCTGEIGNCGCMHSEPQAIIDCLKRPYNNYKFILLCTYSPCTNCANIIINSGIVEGVVYDILTEHDKRGDEILRKFMPVVTIEDIRNGHVDAILSSWINSY